MSLALVIVAAASPAFADIVHVFLMNGQSNMSGYGVSSSDLTGGLGYLNIAQSSAGDSVMVSYQKTSTVYATSFTWLQPGAASD